VRDPTVNDDADWDVVIPFASARQGENDSGGDHLDHAGQSILRLLHKAAAVVEENDRHALDKAQTLSRQLGVAEDRVAELEAEVETYRERAERAEQWLQRVHAEIEERLLDLAPSVEYRSATRRTRAR
jgi:molecular chaperone GrpE (heat shock protein)